MMRKLIHDTLTISSRIQSRGQDPGGEDEESVQQTTQNTLRDLGVVRNAGQHALLVEHAAPLMMPSPRNIPLVRESHRRHPVTLPTMGHRPSLGLAATGFRGGSGQGRARPVRPDLPGRNPVVSIPGHAL